MPQFNVNKHFSDISATTFSLNMQGKWQCMCNQLGVHWECSIFLQVPTYSNYSYY